jgi:DNA invertase Pin-like site-specific DNA recombinase
MIFNYLRVSTVLQNTERQLLDVPCDRVYEDKLSGKDTNRPQFQLMMSNLRPSDVVNVHSLDRVGRNTKDILEIVETIKEIGATIKFHKESLTFDGSKSDLYSDLMLTILSGFAQFERNIILERQREGIAIAKMNGKYKGGKQKFKSSDKEEIKKLIEEGVSISQISRTMNCSRPTIYKVINET